MIRRLAAEALGTFLLVATVIGSGILADRLSGDHGVALLGNTLATAAMLVVLVTALGPISGAHLNPAVTLVFVCLREIGIGAALLYVAAQAGGAVLGAIAAHAMYELPLIHEGAIVRAGFGQGLSEALATFALVFAILFVRSVRAEAVPLTVGLTIAAGYWWTASTSFANPAVTLARAMTDTFSGIRWADAPAFWAAQIAGALGALAIFLAFGRKGAPPAN
ncbi:MAG: aquaporin [Hyphomonadaceae bacterium]